MSLLPIGLGSHCSLKGENTLEISLTSERVVILLPWVLCWVAYWADLRPLVCASAAFSKTNSVARLCCLYVCWFFNFSLVQ